MELAGGSAPKARAQELLITEAGDELVVYDLKNLTAHRLNATSVLVWKACDGKRTVSEIAGLLGHDVSGSVDERLVWYALKRLRSAGLLEAPYDIPEAARGLTREQLVKVAGLAAFAAIPLVSTMLVPSAAAAASCTANGQPCAVHAQCCSTVCSTGVCIAPPPP